VLDELLALVARHARGRKATLLDGVAVSCLDAATEPVVTMAEPSLAVVACGVKRTVLNGVPYDYRAGQYLVVSLDLPVLGQALEASPEAPFAVFSMRLRPEAIAPLLLETRAGVRPPTFAGLAVSDATPELLDPIVRLLRAVERPDDLRVLAPGLEREILWRLVTGEQGGIVRQIGLADSSLAHITRVIRWIREHHDAPLRIAELAELAGMSPSTLHRHFRAATSMTPIRFQKQIRLREARVLLMAGAENVAEIGYRVGYDSASQFSREYRREFGVPPRRSVATATAENELLAVHSAL
jgi:AraC-like DNA-binding protein